MDEKVKIELAFKHQKFSGLVVNDEFRDSGEVVNYISTLESRIGELEEGIEKLQKIEISPFDAFSYIDAKRELYKLLEEK